MNEEAARLNSAIKHYRSSQEFLNSATIALRRYTREYLKSKMVKRGDAKALAKALKTSVSQLSNVTHGYGVASAEWAERAMKVCGDAE